MTTSPQASTSSDRTLIPLARSIPEDVPSSSSQVLGRDRKDEKMTLDADDRALICEGWKKPQKFEAGGYSFNWDLNTFLSYFTPYFTGRSVKAKLELIKGILPALGENFIKGKLGKKVDPDLRGLMTAPMWDFCKAASGCELWVTLPPTFAANREILQKFADFSIYCLAVQSLPNAPRLHHEALREFGSLDQNNTEVPTEEKVVQRQKEVKAAIERVKEHAKIEYTEGKPRITVEISDDALAFLKITFAFESAKPSSSILDNLRLDLGMVQDDLFPILILPEGRNGYDVLHEQLVAGSAALPFVSQVIEVLFNSSLNPKEQIAQLEKVLESYKKETAYSEEALQFFADFHATGKRSLEEADVLDLPLWIGNAAERGTLKSTLEKLSGIYQGTRFEHLMKAVEARVLAPQNSGRSVEQVVLEALLLCGESKIFSAAWNLYQKSSVDTELSFLLEIAPRLDISTFPIVMNQVCAKEIKSPEERLRLLVVYFNQLTTPGFEPLYSAYSSMLLVPIDGLLETHPLSLDLYPKLRQALSDRISMRMGKLKESLALLSSQPDVWWKEFILIQQEIKTPDHQEEFDQLFQAALRIREGHLSTKAGFVPIFIRIAEDLFKRKAYPPLIRLLESVPIVKSDTIVHPRFRRLLESLMEGEISAPLWTSALAIFRTSEAYKRCDRAFLIRVIQHLSGKFTEDGIWREINFLRDYVRPKKEEAPNLPQRLLAYYSRVADLNLLMGDLIRSLTLFATWKEAGATDHILRCAKGLTSHPQDRPAWTRVTTILDEMKGDDFFLEGAISVLETLSGAGVHDASAGCFTNPIPRLKRLQSSQRVRLAVAYSGAIRSVSGAVETQIMRGVPSRDWVLDQLQTEQSWQEYAEAFFSFCFAA
jgi:hypothetical protein